MMKIKNSFALFFNDRYLVKDFNKFVAQKAIDSK